MKNESIEKFCKHLIIVLAILLFVTGIQMVSSSVATLIDIEGQNGGTYAMILISGLAVLATSGLFLADILKPSRTLQFVSFIVDASVMLILFILGIVIVAVGGFVTPGLSNWYALIMLTIIFALLDVNNFKVITNEIKESQKAAAAAAAKASIDEQESINKEKEEAAKEEMPAKAKATPKKEVVKPEVIEEQ